jgi:hypothetical protein
VQGPAHLSRLLLPRPLQRRLRVAAPDPARIPGVELVEPTYWKKDKGLCCGAGGAQMWMEEQNKDRVQRQAHAATPGHRAPAPSPAPARSA